MAKKMADHLDEERIIAAIVEEREIGFPERRHLAECLECRAQKEAIERELSIFGKFSREVAPASFRKPVLADPEPYSFQWKWKVRPSMGMGLVAASLLAFFLFPQFIDLHKPGKRAPMETIYLEMLQDERFMAEIENLEQNPLPRFYVDISDFDQDGPDDPQKQDSKLPNVVDEKALT